MKRLLLLILTASTLLALLGCVQRDATQQGVLASETEQAMRLYREFLAGKQNVVLGSKQQGTLRIDDILSENEADCYAYFDMNGDGIPELHVRSTGPYVILTCRNGALIVWGNFWSWYHKPLNNGAILYERSGIGTTYQYTIFDFYGNELLRIDFGKLEDTAEAFPYYFEDVEVSKEQWYALTEKYLSVGSDKIQWKSFSRR